MKRLLFILSIFCVSTTYAQSTVLEQIEQNNTVLSALRKQADAEKIGNKTGNYLPNPEVELGYLWGNNAEAGNRIDISAKQSFDFPTAYYHRKKVSDAQNQQVDLKYLMEWKEVMLQAKKLCIQLTYQHALHKYLSDRLRIAEQIADVYEKKYKAGDCNVLDFNRSKLNLASVSKVFNSCTIDRDYSLDELARLNGGIALDYAVSAFEPVVINPDFEALYSELQAKNLLLVYWQQETALSKATEKLQRSLNLPKLSAGYMSEKVTVAEHFQGVTVGVSIPLWENKNTVKRIKAQTQANQATEEDVALRYRKEVKALHKKATNLLQVIENYKANSLAANSTELLKKALDSGEISLIDFMLETEVYFDVTKEVLEAERDLNLTLTELYQWEL
jgi:outer membrane protein TolC